jgi:hypothetical protein
MALRHVPGIGAFEDIPSGGTWQLSNRFYALSFANCVRYRTQPEVSVEYCE